MQCKSYDNVKEAIRAEIRDINNIRPGDRVLIKPNLCNPVEDAVTHPEFIRAVIELVKEITPNVILADLPAVNEPGITEEVLFETGVMDVLKLTKTRFSNIEKSGFYTRAIKNYKVLEQTEFAKIFFYADVVINLPKLKTHGLTYLTGAVKNLMGLMHMGERQYIHEMDKQGFADALLDVYNFMRKKTTLHIMDAVWAMEGKGPIDGELTNLGVVLADTDAVSLDYAACSLTGHDPLLMPIEKRARGFEINKKNHAPLPFKKHPNYGRDNDLMPVINEDCRMCGACQRACPAHAITAGNKQMIIDKDSCIKCYCCIENCSHRCINI